jgi:hypothetical protein
MSILDIGIGRPPTGRLYDVPSWTQSSKKQEKDEEETTMFRSLPGHRELRCDEREVGRRREPGLIREAVREPNGGASARVLDAEPESVPVTLGED